MGIKLGKNGKLPGENIIQAGLVFCMLSVIMFLLGAFNGAANGLIFTGGGVLGLLIICVGYLKRISAALVRDHVTEAATAAKV